VLNEPETSLHPDLVSPMAAMIRTAATHTQVVVVTHSAAMREHLGAVGTAVELYKEWGETRIAGQTLLSTPAWDWGKR
jgi:predicted ATPase